MITAIVLIKAETHKISELGQELVKIDGVREVFSVAGRYDLVAIVRASDHEKLAEIISDKAGQLVGIGESETLIAFRVFSQRESEAGFDLGLD